MHFCFKLLPKDRWGIYEGDKLLATVGSGRECQKILRALQQRQRSNSLALSTEFQEQLQHNHSRPAGILAKGINLFNPLPVTQRSA